MKRVLQLATRYQAISGKGLSRGNYSRLKSGSPWCTCGHANGRGNHASNHFEAGWLRQAKREATLFDQAIKEPPLILLIRVLLVAPSCHLLPILYSRVLLHSPLLNLILWNLEIQVGLLHIKVNENQSFAAKAPMLSPNVWIAKYNSPGSIENATWCLWLST